MTVATGPRSIAAVSSTIRSLRRSAPRQATDSSHPSPSPACALRGTNTASESESPRGTANALRRPAARSSQTMVSDPASSWLRPVNVPKRLTRPARPVVDAGELAAHVVERGAGERIGAAGRIERPAHQAGLRLLGRRAAAIGARKQRWRGILHHVDDDAASLIPGVEHVEHEAARGTEPAQRGDAPIALDQPDMAAERGLPGERHPPGLGPRHAPGKRHDREHDVPRGDGKIVHHAAIRRLEALDPRHLTIGAERPAGHQGCERAARRIAEEHQFAGARVALGMGGERPLERAEIPHPACRQGSGIDLERQVSFLQGQQTPGVPDDVGVGDPGVGDRASGSEGPPNAETSERPAACSATHLSVRTQRLR